MTEHLGPLYLAGHLQFPSLVRRILGLDGTNWDSSLHRRRMILLRS